jgi:hypothetical protein
MQFQVPLPRPASPCEVDVGGTAGITGFITRAPGISEYGKREGIFTITGMENPPD